MKPNLTFQLKLEQKLQMTYEMKRALLILKLPLLELREFLQLEVEKNPALEILKFSPQTTSLSYLCKNSYRNQKEIPSPSSLFDHLMQQAREIFRTPEERIFAEKLFLNLDTKGFLPFSLEELSSQLSIPIPKLSFVLEKIKTLDPLGIGAHDLQEYFLIQLQKIPEKDLARKIVSLHFSSFLKGNWSLLQKQLGVASKELFACIQKDLSHLSLHPAKDFFLSQFYPSSIPDVSLKKEISQWIISVGKEDFSFQIRPDYLKLVTTLPKEDKKILSQWILSGKFLKKNLLHRKKLLFLISSYILKHQRSFLESGKNLKTLSVGELASDLSIHPSTAFRILSEKSIECPQGLFPLKFFFSPPSSKNDLPPHAILKTLQTILEFEKESFEKPLSDQQIAKILEKKQILCSRRTIAKYRKQLNIASSFRRTKFPSLKNS